MSIRIRCTGCKKKVSVDSAFAGGMCRCPYCKEIVLVPGERSTAATRAARPVAPGARPDAPTSRIASGGRGVATKVHVPNPEDIPMANPVRMQGIFALILLICLVMMLGLGAYLAYIIFVKPPDEKPIIGGDGYVKVNAFINTVNPGVAGDIKLQSPIMYVIDYGGKMQFEAPVAEKIVEASVKTMPSDARFNLMRVTEEGPVTLASDYVSGGSDGLAKLSAFASSGAGGRSDVSAGVKKALESKPKSLVLLINRAIDSEEAAKLAPIASGQGTSVVVLYIAEGLGASDAKAAMSPLTGSGGTFRELSNSDLGNELQEAENQK